ncbi:MAG: hypothetical protein CEE38_07430 [Planctomycetes bacterium B3_Pla]|nr:MAG: hypothetical protein CEE38_07430 [Planctomycetes bacterium B3_Pla]
MNDKNEQAGSRQSDSNLQPCCDGGSCCPSGSDGGGKSWKIAVFILIVLAAGVVLARSLFRKSDSPTEQGQNTFAAIQPEIVGDAPSPQNTETTMQNPTASKGDAETPAVANEKTKENISDEASLALWGPELDSLASLNKAAANSAAVFILLAAEDQESNQAATKQIEAAAKMIRTGGTSISAFRLKQGAPNYANLTKQLSVPCVLAMVKGGGVSGVSADQLTETKLVQAFVTASRPSSGCCPPGSGVTCE